MLTSRLSCRIVLALPGRPAVRRLARPPRSSAQLGVVQQLYRPSSARERRPRCRGGRPGDRRALRTVRLPRPSIWSEGSTFLAIRLGVRELPPLLFAGFRFLMAGRAAHRRGPRDPRAVSAGRARVAIDGALLTAHDHVQPTAEQPPYAVAARPLERGALLAAGSALWITRSAPSGHEGIHSTVRRDARAAAGFPASHSSSGTRETTPSGYIGLAGADPVRQPSAGRSAPILLP